MYEVAAITPDEQHDYVKRVVTRDETWRLNANCRDGGPQLVDLFCCLEDDLYVNRGGFPVRVDAPKRREIPITGLSMQQYVVGALCVPCPVQWECARHALEHEADNKRSTGAWSMTRRDLRWLAGRSDAMQIVDTARYEGVAVSIRVEELQRAKAKPDSVAV